MNDMAERLQIARRRAGYFDATAAARAFGWNENTYRSHENSARGLRRESAERYAKAFHVSAGWLLTGEGDGPNVISRRLSIDAIDLRKVVSLLLRTQGATEEHAADLAGIVVDCFSAPPLAAVDGDLVRSVAVRLELQARQYVQQGSR